MAQTDNTLIRRSWLMDKALGKFSKDGFVAFEAAYKQLQASYVDSLSSESTQFQSSPEIAQWLPELISTMGASLPLIVAKMSQGDTLALCVYNAIYTHLQQPELILSYDKIFADEQLIARFMDKGLSAAALSEMTVEQWVYVGEGRYFLCGDDISCLHQLDCLYPAEL